MPVSKETYAIIYRILEKTKNDSLNWKIRDFLKSETNTVIYFLNAHAINMAVHNNQFSNIIGKGNYLLRDGIGIHLALRFLRLGQTENLNGTDLIPKIIAQYKNKKIALLGSSDEALATLKSKLESEGYSNIVLSLHGFYEDEKYISGCQECTPDIVILCMGMPKQEILSEKLKPHAKLIICAGGWADFYSGTKIRAPQWVQNANLEWVHRLVKEPKRLGKRYTIDILYYFYNIFRVWLISRKQQ